LFLLDEPDTHLNPKWSVDYIGYLKQFVTGGLQREETSHILLTTHNPLAVAELVRNQVQILHLQQSQDQRRIVACHPELDPRGMGYAAIVTSDMFGIASTLDSSTQVLLEEQRALAGKERLSPEELAELDKLNLELNRLGFRFFHPDDEFSRYLRLRNAALQEMFDEADHRLLAKHAVALSRVYTPGPLGMEKPVLLDPCQIRDCLLIGCKWEDGSPCPATSTTSSTRRA
jgi:hypothetical protein